MRDETNLSSDNRSAPNALTAAAIASYQAVGFTDDDLIATAAQVTAGSNTSLLSGIRQRTAWKRVDQDLAKSFGKSHAHPLPLPGYGVGAGSHGQIWFEPLGLTPETGNNGWTAPA